LITPWGAGFVSSLGSPLSRKAQAEQMMFGGAAGVRDEVGFLIVHQRYADHFFPGTSVLHTAALRASHPLATKACGRSALSPRILAKPFPISNTS
jgi:hypothetical protein